MLRLYVIMTTIYILGTPFQSPVVMSSLHFSPTLTLLSNPTAPLSGPSTEVDALAAAIQRAREMGIPSYVAARKALALRFVRQCGVEDVVWVQRCSVGHRWQ